MTFGFDTAVHVCTAAIDRLHTVTAEAHDRDGGRDDGRHGRDCPGRHRRRATMTLIPEVPFDIGEVCDALQRHAGVSYAPIVVVAEGAVPVPGTWREPEYEVDRFVTVVRRGLPSAWPRRSRSDLHRDPGSPSRHCSAGGTPTASTGCSPPATASRPRHAAPTAGPRWPCRRTGSSPGAAGRGHLEGTKPVDLDPRQQVAHRSSPAESAGGPHRAPVRSRRTSGRCCRCRSNGGAGLRAGWCRAWTPAWAN